MKVVPFPQNSSWRISENPAEIRTMRALKGGVCDDVVAHYLHRHLRALITTALRATMSTNFTKNAEESPEPQKAEVKGEATL